MSRAAKYTIKIEGGASYKRKFVLRNQDGSIVDLTNKTIRMEWADSAEDRISDRFYYEGDREVKNYLEQGFFTFKLGADQTDDSEMDFDSKVYDVELVDCVPTVIPFSGGFNAVSVEVDIGGGKSRITANSGTPFSGLSQYDKIRISGAEDPLHDGSYNIDTATSTVLTFTRTMSGIDNPADTAMVIKQLVLSTTEIERILQGSVSLNKNVTERT